MTKPTYRIVGWDDRFENHESRKIKVLNWVAMPNHHDTAGYRRLVTMPNGAALYGAWCAVVQVASRCPVRGVLASASRPLEAIDLEAKTGMKSKLFDELFSVVTDPSICWLETDLPVCRDKPGESPGTTPIQVGRYVGRYVGREGTEGKGITPLPPKGGSVENDGDYRVAVAKALRIADCKATSRKLDRWVRSAVDLDATPQEVARKFAILVDRVGVAKASPNGLFLEWSNLR